MTCGCNTLSSELMKKNKRCKICGKEFTSQVIKDKEAQEIRLFDIIVTRVNKNKLKRGNII